MKIVFWKTALCVVCIFFMPGFSHAVPTQPFVIGAGDVLDISVWKNSDLTRQVIVLPDGTIHFPLIGEFVARGVTVAELKKQMIERIEKYVPEPELTISITQINSTSIYVIGKVNKPGTFKLIQQIDVLQALALAGGLNAFAKEKEIRIFRKNKDTTAIFFFNYNEVSKGENLEQNMVLEPGDVIVVR